MITLNLIPPIKKHELRLAQLYLVIKNLIIFTLFITVIVGIVLLASKMILQNHFNKMVAESTLTTKYANIFNKDIKEFNRQLNTVETIQKDHVAWTNFFIKFSPLVPDDIGIYNLSLDKDKIVLTGLAKTRDQLLKFKENLENSSLFSEVITPLEDLLKKENVDFHIKAKINLAELENYDN
jgi:Tfp pilus assembly protein PilN